MSCRIADVEIDAYGMSSSSHKIESFQTVQNTEFLCSVKGPRRARVSVIVRREGPISHGSQLFGLLIWELLGH